jgi:hypothetical protein
MEQGNTDQNDIQISGEKIVSPEGTNEYKVYEHPLLPKRIVKIGVCWPALIVGPAYLIYRRLWGSIIVWILAIVLVRYWAFTSFQICNIYGNECYFDADGKTTVEQISEGAIFVGLLLLLFITNSIWEKDLNKRGYTMTKSLRARSMDDALAILEREKKPLVQGA